MQVEEQEEEKGMSNTQKLLLAAALLGGGGLAGYGTAQANKPVQINMPERFINPGALPQPQTNRNLLTSAGIAGGGATGFGLMHQFTDNKHDLGIIPNALDKARMRSGMFPIKQLSALLGRIHPNHYGKLGLGAGALLGGIGGAVAGRSVFQ